ncbi:MAG: DNA primase [Candidatus Aenigmarchaeota archaeon]|nr:DNA primase [Candidatus Aenigmarchaeota archaeon]
MRAVEDSSLSTMVFFLKLYRTGDDKMGKLAQATSKYTVYAKFNADGTVEKPDVIGAVFGQTEGLLGQELDLRELQRTGRIGRIDVDMSTKGGKTSGVVTIPSSLDSSETALIAACMETIERVGPCNAKIRIEKIEDVRISKRKYVIERAKELLASMFDEGLPEAQEISEHIKEAVRVAEVVNYKGSPAGPNIDKNDAIIVVEGRADVIKLMKNGIKNVIAIGGTSISKTVAELSKKKETTVFLDGDRGGDLILKEFAAVADVDFVSRAPMGKEVEDLSKKEIFKAIREKVQFQKDNIETHMLTGEKNGHSRSPRPLRPATRIPTRTVKRIEMSKPTSRPAAKPQITRSFLDEKKKKKFKETLEDLTGSRAAVFLDSKMEALGKVPSREVFNAMKELDNIDVVVIDGTVDQKLVQTCSERGLKYVVAMRTAGRIQVPENIKLVLLQNLK